MCGGRLDKVETRIMNNLIYDILKCEKCKHTIARHREEILR